MPVNADANSVGIILGSDQLTIKFMLRIIKGSWPFLFDNIPKIEMVQLNKVIDILSIYDAAESFEKETRMKIKFLAIEELEGILNEMKVKLAG